MKVPRLRDRPEYWTGREIVDRWAREYGGHWCVCWIKSTDTLAVVEYEEACKPDAEPVILLYQRDGGGILPAHPKYLEKIGEALKTVVVEMGAENARRFAAYLEALPAPERQKLIRTNWYADIIAAFRGL